MQIPDHYSEQMTPERQVIYALSLLKKGSASEIAMQLMELKGISSEEGLAELVIETEQELERMVRSGLVEILREKHEKKRYTLRG